MLDMSRTTYTDSNELPVHSTSGPIEAGQGLVQMIEDGLTKAIAGDGSSNDVLFVGVALAEMKLPGYAVNVETVEGPDGGGSVELLRAPLGGVSQVLVKQVSTGDVMPVVTGTPTSGQVQLVDNELTFHADEATKQFSVTYRHELTVTEAQLRSGDGVIGNASASDVTGTIGLIRKGDVYTDNFNTGDDWSADNAEIKVGSDGRFQIGGTGASVQGYVTAVPTADQPYLGIHLDA